MSAVIAILNSQAVAIAADSAVTVNGKIFNRALKIFNLSKFEPIGIMIYGSGGFMSTPWETIIKVYRSGLKDTSFNTVEAYKDDFVNFLNDNNYFVSEDHQKAYIQQNVFYKIFSEIHQTSIKITKDPVQIVTQIDLECDRIIQLLAGNTSICAEFVDYTINEFDAFLGPTFIQSIKMFFTDNGLILSANTIDNLKQICFSLIQKQEQFTFYTGVVFVGFGSQEIFPSLISINIHFAVQNRLKQYELVNERRQITHEIGSAISPFAQTEAMNTILTGIAPNLQTIYNENFKQYITKYNNLIVNILGQDSPLAQQIQAIDVDTQVQEFTLQLDEAKTLNYIKPLVDAVSSLSKEDLAEMAESLIYLTYLQKRITFAAEDVGGDVDVAVISKGDGFIWIKRKHYFKPELNTHFFENYLKH